jgi:hypothetical protein
MRKRLKLPSPALIVACIALAVALGGTSFAAVRALGDTFPVSSLTVRLASGTVSQHGEAMYSAGCATGERAISGGWQQHASGTAKAVFSLDDGPSEDLTRWNDYLVNAGDDIARVDVFVVCAK